MCSAVDIHTALCMFVAFWILRNMSEILKALYGHLIPQLFLLSFLASQLFSQLLSTASGGHNVTQLPLTVFDHPPPYQRKAVCTG